MSATVITTMRPAMDDLFPQVQQALAEAAVENSAFRGASTKGRPVDRDRLAAVIYGAKLTDARSESFDTQCVKPQIQPDDRELFVAFPGCADIPYGILATLADALTGNIRVKRGTQHLYTRAVRDGRFVKDKDAPLTWRMLKPVDVERSDKKSAWPHFEELLADGLSSAGMELLEGFELRCSNGRLIWWYDKGTQKWLRCCDNRTSGTRTIGTATERVDVPEDLLTLPHVWSADTPLNVATAVAVIERVREAFDKLTTTAGDTRNLLLMCGAPFMRSHPEQMYILAGPGGTGKTSLLFALKNALGGALLPNGLMDSRAGISAENAMAELMTAPIAVMDDYVPSRSWNAEEAAWKTLSTGGLFASARRIGRDATTGKNNAVITLSTNVRFPVGDDTASQRRFICIACDGREGLAAIKNAIKAGADPDEWNDTEMIPAAGVPMILAAGCDEWVQAQGRHVSGTGVWVDPNHLPDGVPEAWATAIGHEENEPWGVRDSNDRIWLFVAEAGFGSRPLREQYGWRKTNRRVNGRAISTLVPPKTTSPLRPLWEKVNNLMHGGIDGDDGDTSTPTPPAVPPTTGGGYDEGEEDDTLLNWGLSETPGWAPSLLALLDDGLELEPAASAPNVLPNDADDQADVLKVMKSVGITGDAFPLVGGSDYSRAKRPAVPSWKALLTDTATVNVHGDYTPGDMYGISLADGWMVLDLDEPKGKDSALLDGAGIMRAHFGTSGNPDGLGDPALVVRTASGGLHAYYRIPERLRTDKTTPWSGIVKNAAHPWAGKPLSDMRAEVYAAGVPVDVRCGRVGYTVMPGSTLPDGRGWTIERVGSANGTHELPLNIEKLLRRWGLIVTDAKEQVKPFFEITGKKSWNLTAGRQGTTGRPDMAPVPEGQRNETIHDWGYGRHVHYPNECPAIDSDIRQRAAMSGLPASEAETIIGSIHHALAA